MYSSLRGFLGFGLKSPGGGSAVIVGGDGCLEDNPKREAGALFARGRIFGCCDTSSLVCVRGGETFT